MPQEILNIIWSALGIIITGLVGWGVDCLVKFLNSKIKDKELAHLLTNITLIITDAVKQVYQEFVESLKKTGSFDATAQKQALLEEPSATLLGIPLSSGRRFVQFVILYFME